MPRLSVCLTVLVCVCACVTLCKGEDFQTKLQPTEEDFLLPEEDKESNIQQDDYDVKSQDEVEVLGNRDTRSPLNSLWARILSRLGKTSETFATSGHYPTRVSRTNGGHRFYAPLWSKFKRNQDGFAAESAMNDGIFRTVDKKAGLSINGALSSLADMLNAEGHRRDQAAAHHLRQRLLVAGKRR